jgi:hypothetical protein
MTNTDSPHDYGSPRQGCRSNNEGYVEPSLSCFSCGHQYGYLGANPPPGHCPACDSRVISLVEPFEPTEFDVNRATGEEATHPIVRLVGRDATGRTIRFYLHTTADSTGLVPSMIGVDDVLFETGDQWRSGFVLPTIAHELEAHGFQVGTPDDTGKDVHRPGSMS